jgi:hypothetical protein
MNPLQIHWKKRRKEHCFRARIVADLTTRSKQREHIQQNEEHEHYKYPEW